MALALTAGLLAAASPLFSAAPAQAAPGDPFDPAQPQVFVVQLGGGSTDLYRSITDQSGETSFETEGGRVDVQYNAIAFNPADNYIYGMTTAAGMGIPAGSLVRVGEGNTVTRVGTTVFGGADKDFNSGSMGPDDLYYAMRGINGERMLVIDPATGDLVRDLPLSQVPNVSDFSLVGGYFWGVSNDSRHLVRINPVSGQVTQFNNTLPAATRAGAVWTFGNGNFGVKDNTTGLVYQYQIDDPGAATPTFTLVSTAEGPGASNSDGTSVAGDPVDLEIAKSAATTFVPGGEVTYTLSVTNHGPGTPSGYVVTDELPTSLTNPRTDAEGCTVTGNTVTCLGGSIPVGESVEIVVTADAPAEQTECIDNTATVIGNERDPETGNNEDTVTVCPGEPQLQLEKTSDATDSARAGETVTYTVTATNTGSNDFTDENPAVVFDDLSGILDDAEYNSDAQANQAGDVSYESPLVSWTGPLATGESVEITYTVTLQPGGDGVVRNVAWQPEVPEVPEAPVCDPRTEEGVDPETGEPCAVSEFELPRLTIDKSADRTELPAVGESVEYTVTVTNEGPGDYTADAPATFTDDLADVLDAATFNDDATASVGEASYDAPTLSWEGPLAAGESATITYTVNYTGEGDQNLRNLACISEVETAPGAAPCDFVQIPGSDLTQWKQVEASGTPAVEGSVLTYTLFFENDGETAATVDSVDDLTHITDDADVTTEPTATAGLNVSRDGDRISITGEVPAGETASVTYQVTVKADGERGDDIAANFLMENDPEDPPTPPEDPVCEPTDEQRPDCTSTPIATVAYAKSVESSETPIGAGTVLTYTVAVDNTGAVTAPVSREDVLTDVLDDAELTSAPVSDTDSVTVSGVADGRFQIGGELAAGETATVTYEVTVKDEADRGNNSADNFLVAPGGDPPEECEPAEGELADCTSTPLPNVEASKSSDPESGSTVAEGQLVAYTLTFTNTGEGAGAVDYIDDQSGVLDDATLASGPEASDGALTVSLNADNTLAVNGELAAGQTVTVTYAVTVNPDEQRGDNLLGNVLAKTGNSDPNCGDADVSCTEHSVPLLDSWKEVEADGSPVAEGTVLTYTLFFENSGEAPAVVDEIDDLTHVTDDTDVTTEPSSDDLTVTREGNRIAITGEVPAGETYQVTYQVTVKPDGERGDDIAANFLMENDPEDPPTVPEEPACQPDDTERPDCTGTPIGKLQTSKSVSADTDPVDVGTVLTYTLTFDNQGEGSVGVDHTDILTDVLDDATLTTAPAASDDVLTVSDVADGQFAVTGELAAGQTVTVTYQVTVKEEADRGNNTADNFLIPGGENPSEECVEGDPNCTVTPLPLIGVDKTADPGTGSDVQAGQDVTYTLTFTNTGEVAGSVDYTDNLAGVLDDADLKGAPTSSDPALVPTDGADGQVRVTGSLEPGQTVTVSYTVTVKADGDRGDNELGNVVAKTGNEDPECEDAGVSCTAHPVGELDDWKTVDPASGTTVQESTALTYTLHFENIGKAPVDVNREDNLALVLDDADVTGQPVASSDALAVTDIADGRFQITGTLQPGQSETVTYKVTVKKDGERGDDRLGNFLVNPGEEPPSECVPTDDQRPDCTVNHVNDVVVEKSSDPASGTEVNPGDDVTYTLTFANTSANPDAAPVAVDYTDHMADVLDDATLTGGPVVSNENLTAVTEGDTIRITGNVPTGATYTVAYTITVNDYAEQGNARLGNVVAITGEEPVCAGGSPLCTVHDVPPAPEGPDGNLPPTGGEITAGVVTAATAVLLLGGLLLVASRRRKAAARTAVQDVAFDDLM